MDKTTAAILVDYDYYRQSQKVRDFVHNRAPYASMVALVGSPLANDPENDPADNPFDWNVVIRNTKGHPDTTFKVSALSALSSYSNLYPALSIDLFNQKVYDEAGVLIALDGSYFGF